jgi:LysM repeat protein
LWRLDHPDAPLPARDPSDAGIGIDATTTPDDAATADATSAAAASPRLASMPPGPSTLEDGWTLVATDGHDPEDAAQAHDVPAAGPRVDAGPPEADVDPFAACRYLVAANGGWRSSDAIRDHRCAALDPPSPISLDKQRRLCLAGAHVSCPTFLAARAERSRALGSVDPAWEPARPVVRTAPVLVGSPQRDRAFAGLVTPARLGEAALGIMAIVVVVLLGSRLLGGAGTPEPSPIAGVGATDTPTAAVGASPSSAAGSPGTDDSTPTPAGSGDASVSPEPTAAGSAAPSAKPSASPKRTYKVKSGDTLTAIAARYGTTVTAIMKLNKIKDARSIRSGQVLKIP